VTDSEKPSTPLPSDPVEHDLVYALACTPDLAVCFAARGSGLYRSLDQGHSWALCYGSLGLSGPLPTTSVALTPEYDGVTHRTLFAGVPGGVLRSVDGGETWTASSLASPPPAVSCLAISPAFEEDGVVLAGTTEDGVFRSATHGSHWARWNFGLLDLHVYCLAISPGFATDETLFAGVESGLFRSTNGGRAWREVELAVGYEPVVSLALSPHFPEDGHLFVGTETQGLQFSADGGASWTRLGAELIRDPVNSIILSDDYPANRSLLVLCETAIWVSADGGASWCLLEDTPERMSAVAAPQGLSSGALLLVGTLSGEVVRLTL